MKPPRLVSLALALSLLCGCVAAPAVPGPDGPSPSPAAAGPLDRPQGDAPAVEPLAAEQAPDANAALSQFGVELLRASRVDGENTLLSPLSVALALGMTANGAQGDTLRAFEDVFHMDLATLNGLCAQLMADYAGLGGSTESTLANSLWADPDVALEDPFLLTCMDTYASQLFSRDLQDPATVREVNRWAEDATHGLIPQVVETFGEGAVLALVNAVYFKNRFESPFPPSFDEWTLEFHNADGTVSEPLGMACERSQRCLAHDGGRGVVLPYDDARLGLLLMLPDEGTSLTEYLSGWDGATVRSLLDGQQETRVALTCPKFKVEWSSEEFGDVLANMGLAPAFDPRSAEFDAMGRTATGDPLYIGSVIHKTAFELAEEGTEAAAATAVSIPMAGIPEPEEFIELTFDRPFVYGIVDLQTGFPLFLGTVERL